MTVSDTIKSTSTWLTVGAILGLVSAVYHREFRPGMLRWGASDDEVRSRLPGDELVAEPTVRSTRAITISAPPAYIWPWLVQVGYGRGGWYSHDIVERLMLAGRYAEGHSAQRIHPELQELSVGDDVPFGIGVTQTVEAIEPYHFLVIGKSWAFVLEPLGGNRTRLIVRSRGPGWVRGLFASVAGLRELGALVDYVVGEPLHHVMERKMMLGLARRAEIAWANAQRDELGVEQTQQRVGGYQPM